MSDSADERMRMTFMAGHLNGRLKSAARIKDLEETVGMLAEHDPKCPAPRECWCMDAPGLAKDALSSPWLSPQIPDLKAALMIVDTAPARALTAKEVELVQKMREQEKRHEAQMESMKDRLREGAKYLREAHARWTPGVTNSFVVDFFKRWDPRDGE